MGRPTIALCAILKNEIENLPRFLESIEGCFDEIHMVDTGSTDGSVDWIFESSLPGLRLHHFEWIDDFSAARNFAFSKATTDYIMWMDLDDVLSDKKAFCAWRDNVMSIAEYWMATYHYAFDANQKPVCTFARERVIKNHLGMTWKYFVHEGIVPPEGRKTVSHYATTWAIHHLRSASDLTKDRARNLQMIQRRDVATLEPRMRYYLGKELLENGQSKEAFEQLVRAAGEADLELHDRILSLQYASIAATHLNQPEKSIALSFQGLQLDPLRAEFWTLIGDNYVKMNRIEPAIPFYQAALHCRKEQREPLHAAPIFMQADVYGHYPHHQLARLYLHLGRVDLSLKEMEKARALGFHPEHEALAKEIDRVHKASFIPKEGAPVTKTEDIVFLGWPNGLYEWDRGVADQRGVGGSEIACIEMAENLAKVTRRPVKVFNNRETRQFIKGVEYIPIAEANAYFAFNAPKVCINWRHTLRLTHNAPVYVWMHDLVCPGVDDPSRYDKLLVLSEFQKTYLNQLFNVPLDKMIVTRNGLDVSRFEFDKTEKVDNQVVFSSSPDRGLDRAMLVMDEVVKRIPNATLEVYYGFDNMLKLGLNDEVDRFKKMLLTRPWVHFHGNIDQRTLATRLSTAMVWLYPTNFLETFCITALEMRHAQVWPVVRKWGALETTVDLGDKVDSDCVLAHEITNYANHVVWALEQRKYLNLGARDLGDDTWESIAEEWVECLSLPPLSA